MRARVAASSENAEIAQRLRGFELEGRPELALRRRHVLRHRGDQRFEPPERAVEREGGEERVLVARHQLERRLVRAERLGAPTEIVRVDVCNLQIKGMTLVAVLGLRERLLVHGEPFLGLAERMQQCIDALEQTAVVGRVAGRATVRLGGALVLPGRFQCFRGAERDGEGGRAVDLPRAERHRPGFRAPGGTGVFALRGLGRGAWSGLAARRR